MNEKISVIIPVYNVEQYLDKCLKSVVNQTYENIEVILVDDGSKDSSLMICEKWAKIDNRIKVVHKENGGVSGARNIGIKMATGEFIHFTDPDDYLELDMYEKNIEKSKKYDLVACAYYVDESEFGKEEKTIKCTTFEIAKNHDEVLEKNYSKIIGFSTRDIKRWNRGESISKYRSGGMVWQYIFKTNIIKENNVLFDEKLIYKEDEMFVANYLVYAKSVFVNKKPYYNYLQRNTSAVHNMSDKQKIDAKFEMLEE